MDEADEISKQKSAQEKALETGGGGYTERLVTKLVDNLQVFINKVHIRYEHLDPDTEESSGFALGITLQSLNAQSTDEEWRPAYLSDAKRSLIHKLAALNELSVYAVQNRYADGAF
jgi:vacuolar protein sorting-associated protein 13A/C